MLQTRIFILLDKVEFQTNADDELVETAREKDQNYF